MSLRNYWLVANWLRPAIPRDMIADQFGFRPTGSTDCALIFMMLHVSAMLENCEYVRCLVIDFSRAFNVVNHVILLDKLSKLNLPDYIVTFLLTVHKQLKLVIKFLVNSLSTEALCKALV